MRTIFALFLAALLPREPAHAQNPLRHWTDAIDARYAETQPVLAYTLRVDSADLSAFAVEIRIRSAPDTFRLALAVHPEYDDRFYRYVEGVTVASPGGSASVTREDSTRWRVVAPGGACTVRYRVRLPVEPSPRAAWRPFLSPTGGLVGGTHAFMYVVGESLAPAHVTLEVTTGWAIATGLEPTADAATYYARSAQVLTESPMLVGQLREWSFRVDDTPHRVAYWPAPDATPFDTAALVDGLSRIVRQAARYFGRLPYREYDFLLQDHAVGSLEHANSVTMGARSAHLAEDLADAFPEAAHEYVHAWNLMRIRPAEYADVSDRTPPRSRGLWWAEGATVYLADLLLRRAGLATSDSTRTAHLESLIARYLARPGNSRFAPESVSVLTYGGAPGALGDYDASVHLQGELIAALLDLRIDDATGGRRSLADVMRLLLQRSSGETGYTGQDIERAVAEVCGCDMKEFFDRQVRAGNALEFDRYLSVAGLRARVTWGPALSRDGSPAADLRAFAWLPEGDSLLSLRIVDPAGAWGRAGLHTGDKILAINGSIPRDWQAWRTVVNGLRIGDSVAVDVRRNGRPVHASVIVTGYDRPFVRLEDLPQVTERQRAVRTRWLQAASPPPPLR